MPAAASRAAGSTSTRGRREHDARVRDAARGRRFVSATALARARRRRGRADDPGLAKDGRDLELPPWNKGRYGTAIGRAVHAVLQTVDLATGAGLDDPAAAQAAAEGVLGHEATIAALVRVRARQRDACAAACAREYWRETYVAVPVEGITLEGYVDLVYRDDRDGLVVVDYKTDAIGDEADLAAALAHYRIQGAAYAIAVARRRPASRSTACVFVFLDPDGRARSRSRATDLAAAIAEVRGDWSAEDATDPVTTRPRRCSPNA